MMRSHHFRMEVRLSAKQALIVSIPHVNDILYVAELVNEGNGFKRIHGHGKWVTLGLLRPQHLAIHKEFSGFLYRC